MKRETRAKRMSGFTLVEVTVACAVLAVAIVGILGTMTLGVEQSSLATDTSVAVDAARKQAERVSSYPFKQIFALFDDISSDDPGGPGTGFLPWFDVVGLVATSADGHAGHIVFPSPAGTGTLRQDTVMPALGMPRDLTGDGVVSSTNVAGSYKLLPVQIKVDWRGSYGTETYSIYLLLADRTGS